MVDAMTAATAGPCRELRADGGAVGHGPPAAARRPTSPRPGGSSPLGRVHRPGGGHAGRPGRGGVGIARRAGRRFGARRRFGLSGPRPRRPRLRRSGATPGGSGAGPGARVAVERAGARLGRRAQSSGAAECASTSRDLLDLRPVDLVDLGAQEFDQVVAARARPRTRRRPGPATRSRMSMATMSPPTAPIRLATRPSAPGRSGSRSALVATTLTVGDRYRLVSAGLRHRIRVPWASRSRFGTYSSTIIAPATAGAISCMRSSVNSRQTRGRGRPEGSAGSVAGTMRIGAPNRMRHRLERPQEPRVDRLDLGRPDDAHRDDRHAALPGQPGHPGASLVDEGHRATGSLRGRGRAAGPFRAPRRR